MTETVKRIIDNMELELELMPTSALLDKNGPLAVIQNIIGPPIASWIDANITCSEGWITEAVMQYLTGFNQYADINDVAKQLLHNCTVVHVAGNKAGSGVIKFDQYQGWKKDPFHYDNLFRGKVDTLLHVLLFAIEVNYPAFFGKVSMYAEMLRGFMETEKEKHRAMNDSLESENNE
jgi:hypothetical protein